MSTGLQAAERHALNRTDTPWRRRDYSRLWVKIFGIGIFIGTLTLSQSEAGSGLGEGLASNIKLYYRVIPYLLMAPACLFFDARYYRFQGLKSFLRWPLNLLAIYFVIGLVPLFLIEFTSVALWKSFELILGMYWVSLLAIWSKRKELPGQDFRFLSYFAIFFIFQSLAMAALVPSHSFRTNTDARFPILICSYPYLPQDHLAAFACIALAYQVPQYFSTSGFKLPNLLLSLATGGVLLLCQSRTSWAAAMAVIVVFTFVRFLRNRGRHLLSRNTLALAAAILPLIGILCAYTAVRLDKAAAIVSRGQDSSELASISGRTEFWSIAVEEIQKHPIIGSGMSVSLRNINEDPSYAKTLAGVNKKWASMTPNLHSSLLEGLMNAGILGGGCLCFFIIVVLPYRSIRSMLDDQLSNQRLACLGLAVFIHAPFLSVFSQMSNLFLYMALLAAHWTIVEHSPVRITIGENNG